MDVSEAKQGNRIWEGTSVVREEFPHHPFEGRVYGEGGVTGEEATNCFQRISREQNQEGCQDGLSFSDTSGLGLAWDLHKEAVVAKWHLEQLVEDEKGRESVGDKIAQGVGRL